MTRNVRVGLISTSWWAEMMYLPSVGSHPRGEIYAVCGRDQKRLRKIAKKYRIEKSFTDYREMIHECSLDAVIVASPDDLHFPMTMEALDAGLHVLCEKPLAINTQQAREMLEKAERAGVVHMILFTWRWMPAYRYLSELISEGYLGECFQSYMNFYVSSGRNIQEYKWQYDAKRSMGVISGLGSHMFDLSRWFLGDISKVNAHFSTFIKASRYNEEMAPTNDNATVGLQFKNHSQGVMQLSGIAYIGDGRFEQRIALHGTLGTLEANMIFAGKEKGIRLKGGRVPDESIKILSIPDRFMEGVDPNDLMDPFVRQSAGPRLFIDAILRGHSVSPDFHDGLEVQKIIDACIESDKRRAWAPVG